MLGILLTWLLARDYLAGTDIPLMVASMGASSVLLFAVPLGKLSQPWNLLTGHLVSAAVGVACARWIQNPALAAPLAVGLAITAMYYTHSIHPPGGATALMAVIGGPGIHALGFQYLLTPVLINVVVLLVVAFLFNLPFAWRRYPAGLHRPTVAAASGILDQRDARYALERAGTVMDITDAELLELFSAAEEHARSEHVDPALIQLGAYYSNGRLGDDWSVRYVIDGPEPAGGEQDRLIYKVVAGDGIYQTGSCTRGELARWAKHQVVPVADGWVRRDPAPA